MLSACLASGAVADDATPEDEASPWQLFEFGGEIELAYEGQRNFDLDRNNADNLDVLPIELQLEALFEPNDYVEIFFQPTLLQEFELREEGESEDDNNTELLIEEAYVTLTAPARGLSLRVGRQSFEDDRQWLYDAELDAVRGFYSGPDFAVEVSASREALVRADLLSSVEEEPVNNYVLHTAYALNEDVIVGAYGLVFDHRDGERDRPIFVGLQSLGTIGDHLAYWLDAAHVRGREEGTDLRGYGVDVLGTYRFDIPFLPHLLVGYAFGSGDADPEDDRDGAFRQTGLQGNEGEIGSLAPFSYYGEAFDPELSNLSIFTAGFGVRPRENLSVDLISHYYLQDEASDELREVAIDAEPKGESRRLGSEVDLVLGLELSEDFRIHGFLGYFMPGRAFADAHDALFSRIELQYEF